MDNGSDPSNSNSQSIPLGSSAQPLAAGAAHTGQSEVGAGGRSERMFSRKVLDFGFYSGVVLAACCLLFTGLYLHLFLKNIENLTLVDGPLAKVAALAQPVAPQTAGPSNQGAVAQATSLAFTASFATNSFVAVERFSLLSCGLALAMSYGFLGFAMFLIGVRGDVDIGFEGTAPPPQGNGTPGGVPWKFNAVRVAPGLIVIVVAAWLTWRCATFPVSFGSGAGASVPPSFPAAKATASPSPKPPPGPAASPIGTPPGAATPLGP